MSNNKLISIVVPVFNEQEVLDIFFDKLSGVISDMSYDYEIVFVNDGSTDHTLDNLKKIREKDKNIKIINFSRNFGHQAALSAGMNHSRGDVVILMDSDLQDPPSVIPKFLQKWEEGYKVVYGVKKTWKSGRKFKKFFSNLFYKLLNIISRHKIPSNAGDFRLLDRRVVNIINKMPENHKFIRGLSSWSGFKQTGVEFVRPERAGGEPKYSFLDLFRLGMNAITSFSALPLRLISIIGAFSLLISILGTIFILISKLFNLTVPGWSSLMITILFIGGVQFISLGILAEYIGQIYEEIKNRPQYIIISKEGFDKER